MRKDSLAAVACFSIWFATSVKSAAVVSEAAAVQNYKFPPYLMTYLGRTSRVAVNGIDVCMGASRSRSLLWIPLTVVYFIYYYLLTVK